MVLRTLRLKIVLYVVFLAVIVTFGFWTSLNKPREVLGLRVLNLMYSYDDVNELSSNYYQIKRLVSEDDWERLNIDNEIRVVNAYMKLKGDPTRVVITKQYEGLIVYRLENSNVNPNTHWVFQYDIEDGKLSNIREYRLQRLYNGDKGLIW